MYPICVAKRSPTKCKVEVTPACLNATSVVFLIIIIILKP